MDTPGTDDFSFSFSECNEDEDGNIKRALPASSAPASEPVALAPVLEADAGAVAASSTWLAEAKLRLDPLIELQQKAMDACLPDLQKAISTGAIASARAALPAALGQLQQALLLASFPMDCGNLEDAQAGLDVVCKQIAVCKAPLGTLVQASPEAQHANDGKALQTLVSSLHQLERNCSAWLARLAQPSLASVGKTGASLAGVASSAATRVPVDQMDTAATAVTAPDPSEYAAFLDDLGDLVECPIELPSKTPATPGKED